MSMISKWRVSTCPQSSGTWSLGKLNKTLNQKTLGEKDDNFQCTKWDNL